MKKHANKLKKKRNPIANIAESNITNVAITATYQRPIDLAPEASLDFITDANDGKYPPIKIRKGFSSKSLKKLESDESLRHNRLSAMTALEKELPSTFVDWAAVASGHRMNRWWPKNTGKKNMLSAYVSKLQEHETSMRFSEEEHELYTREVNDLQQEINTLKDQLTEQKLESLEEDPELRDRMDDLQWSLGVAERDNDLLKKQVKQLEVEAAQIAPLSITETRINVNAPKITTTLNAMLHAYLGVSLSGETPDSKEIAAFTKDYMSIIEDIKTA
jgi:hypothetical protein